MFPTEVLHHLYLEIGVVINNCGQLAVVKLSITCDHHIGFSLWLALLQV